MSVINLQRKILKDQGVTDGTAALQGAGPQEGPNSNKKSVTIAAKLWRQDNNETLE